MVELAGTGGGGGGGSGYLPSNPGGNGGSGIVVVRYQIGSTSNCKSNWWCYQFL